MAQITDEKNGHQETDVVSRQNYTTVSTRYIELFLNGCDLRRQIK